MLIVQKPEQIKGAELAVTIGFFDGVHIGHQSLISSVMDASSRYGYKTAVYTFWPHPRLVLQKEADKLRFLSTLNEKTKMLSKKGIDYMIVREFTRDFHSLTAEEYIGYLTSSYNVKHISVGQNHRFGKNGEGDVELIKRLSSTHSYSYSIVDEIITDNVTVSSTKIRAALNDGDMERANAMLGYPYLITGTVESGRQFGRQMGFPTANIRPSDPLKLIPKEGVYTALVMVEGQIKAGMVNIGYRPTVDSSGKQTTEVHILDFDNEIYGYRIEVALLKRIRNTKQFPNIETLRQQLADDKEYTLNIYNNLNLESYRDMFLTK